MFPQYLPGRLAYVYARASMWSAVRKSDRILTVSEASKRDILKLLRHPAEKVAVIYNAIDERFLMPPDEERTDAIRQRYQLDHPFLLYVGNIKPHKNLERLIEAFGRVRADGLERAAAGDHRRRDLEVSAAAPGGSSPPAGQVRALPRLSALRDARGVLPPGPRVRVPVALRGLRASAARSDGLRHARRDLERVVAARGCRRRGDPGRSLRSRLDCGRHRPRRHRRGAARATGGSRPGARARLLVGAVGRPRFIASTWTSSSGDPRFDSGAPRAGVEG